jgi:hypothetical protein
MSPLDEVRVTARFTAADPYGVLHTLEEHTTLLYVAYQGNSLEPPVLGPKRYMLEGTEVNKLDNETFRTANGVLLKTVAWKDTVSP